jgi:hypothetical protein
VSGAHTGASALLALLTHETVMQCAGGVAPWWTEGAPFCCPATRARRALRNALRRLLRVHGHRVAPAARVLGTSPGALRAAAAAVGLTLRKAPVGRPPEQLEERARLRHEAGPDPDAVQDEQGERE